MNITIDYSAVQMKEQILEAFSKTANAPAILKKATVDNVTVETKVTVDNKELYAPLEAVKIVISIPE